jgi:hypothetical protein
MRNILAKVLQKLFRKEDTHFSPAVILNLL